MTPIWAAFLLILQTMELYSADTVVNLSPSNPDNNRCRETIVINPGNKTSVVATKKVPDGHCTLFFRAKRNKDYECNRFCVTFREKSFEDCYVKVKFTAVKFERDGDQTKVFDCWHQNSFTGPWCPTADKLQMDLIESESYHFEDDSFPRSYTFSFDVKSDCSKHMDLPNTVKNSNQKKNDRMKQIKVEGIIVGSCLACIFLVLLCVMYMYYRSKAIDEVPSEHTSKRGPGRCFASLRSRFRGDRTRADNDKYHEVRQTDSPAIHDTNMESSPV